MANQSYLSYRDGVQTGLIDLDTAVIKVALVRGYTFSASHTSMADVTSAGGVVNATATLAGITVSGGVVNATSPTTLTTTANASQHILIVYQASAVTGGADVSAANQRLCYYMDTGDNLPIVPGNGTLQINWPTGSSKIYKLGS